MEDLTTIMSELTTTLNLVEEFGLQSEVLASAFLHLKQHPEATIAEALDAGYFEWIK